MVTHVALHTLEALEALRPLVTGVALRTGEALDAREPLDARRALKAHKARKPSVALDALKSLVALGTYRADCAGGSGRSGRTLLARTTLAACCSGHALGSTKSTQSMRSERDLALAWIAFRGFRREVERVKSLRDARVVRLRASASGAVVGDGERRPSQRDEERYHHQNVSPNDSPRHADHDLPPFCGEARRPENECDDPKPHRSSPTVRWRSTKSNPLAEAC